jgi:hypothetical protein
MWHQIRLLTEVWFVSRKSFRLFNTAVANSSFSELSSSRMTYTLHCTKKLLDRIKPKAITPDSASHTFLGNWYATALFWKPQLALLVNEKTLLPVLMPLAPASDLAVRFPKHLANVLGAHDMSQQFIENEFAQMNEVHYAKTANRSVVGVMNQFAYMAEAYRQDFATNDLLGLSIKLSKVPCGPLYSGSIFPERELKRVVLGWRMGLNLKYTDIGNSGKTS